MKKLLISLIASALASFGLLAVSSSPAQADCPYSGCIATDTRKVGGPSVIPWERRNQEPTFRIKVTPESGTGTVEGSVVVRCTSRRTGKSKFGAAELVNGVARVMMNKPLKARGRWDCLARYVKQDPFEPSSTTFVVFRTPK